MEIRQYLDFDFLIRFLEGLQRFLGDKCEIVIHDYRKGYDHSLVYEFNAQLSGRKVGDSPRGGMIASFGNEIGPHRDSREFFFTGRQGQFFKSCTTLIADENQRIVGSVCLNLEISAFIQAQNTIQSFIRYPVPESAEAGADSDDILTRNVDDILKYYIRKAEELAGKPMSLMNRAEKIRALDYLDQKGVFKISKANVLLCELFHLSKYTLYNYLDEARNSRNTDR